MILVAIGRFLSELALLVATFVVGYTFVRGGGVTAWLAGLVLVLLLVVVWGRWIAPRAKHRLDDPPRLIVELVLFGLVGLRLAMRVSTSWGVALIAVGVLFAFLARRRWRLPM